MSAHKSAPQACFRKAGGASRRADRANQLVLQAQVVRRNMLLADRAARQAPLSTRSQVRSGTLARGSRTVARLRYWATIRVPLSGASDAKQHDWREAKRAASVRERVS